MSPNRTSSTESEACKDADDGDDGEEFDKGEGGLLTQRSQRSERVVFLVRKILRERSGLGVKYFFVLVKRGESGCSHSYEHNFRSQISKGKKQFVHVGGVVGGDFDHWAAGGVRFAGDQRCDSGGEESRGSGDGGIDQDSGQRILCGVLAVSVEHEWQDGSGFFKSD